MSQTRVYVVQRPTFKNPATGQYEDKFDLTPALSFGEIVEILKPGNISQDSQNILKYMLQKMEDFQEGDYLLALGDPVAIAAASCVALDITGGVVQMLKWDKIGKVYIPFVIDLRYGTDGAGVYAGEQGGG